ncbi:MAG: amino acid ABC transporter substrate-binding protein [Alphaproteobacteria bacterium]|nr:amino acid ABC transporter substrate-binding protein [Alphaproteobacteria bacterium]
MFRYITFVLALIVTCPALARDHSESVYERVMRSGTIRCGYAIFPPNTMKDPATGTLSGISYDLFNRMGEEMGLNVEWTEEVGFGELVSAMESGRVDAICTAVGVNSARGVRADFVDVAYFAPTGLWVRADDHRFDGNAALLDRPDIKIASLEGTVFDAFIRTYYPRAQIFSLPQLSSLSDQMLVVDTGKADATILDNYIGLQYVEHNPGRMKRLTPKGADFRVDPVAFMIMKGEDEFKSMLNIAQEEQVLTGALAQIVESYELPAGSLYLKTIPFQTD